MKLSELRGVISLVTWDHTVLHATRHKWSHPTLTPARQAGTWFTYSGGTEGWVNVVTYDVRYSSRTEQAIYNCTTVDAVATSLRWL